MKKLTAFLALLLLIPQLCWAVPGQPGGIEIGWLPANVSAGNTKELSLAAGARWEAYSFILSEAKTLNTVRWFIDYIGGAPATGDIRIDVYSDTANAPNATLANSTTTTGSFTADSWVSQTGYSLSLSAGVRYWLVVRNVDAAPTTNFVAIKVPVGSMQANFTQGSGDSAFTFTESVASGASWGNDGGVGLFPMVLGFSDGTYFGLPFAERLRAQDNDATFSVYSTRERGTMITTPANGKLIVKCLTFNVARTGSPTGSLRYRIYSGASPVLVDTTATLLAATLATSGNIPLCFVTPVTLSPSTIYRFVISETTQSDTSTNRINSTYFPTIDTDANSQTLKPFGSATAGTYYNGSTWADNTAEYVPFVMTLEKNGEFAVSGTNYGGYW